MYRDHVPLNWIIEGSNDNINWSPIDEKSNVNICEGNMGHRDNSYPDALFCMNYTERFFNTKTPGYFRMIKVQQKGLNTGAQYESTQGSGTSFYLGAFEIFGEIRGPLQKKLTCKCQRNSLYYFSSIFIIFLLK